ncbi:hypothetical protein [Novosphingobium sediminicola]|uniref:Uncharacterized protein n=1 Tax=Novosphingobium sediminicola TaxID=563162 RepID=A0A7W6CHC3_9SPHN|nr:hypothetical protein [Novosphingobium sediminicola]MBB3956551.1 hypothetical protein [Novosphingobium sediminicola]
MPEATSLNIGSSPLAALSGARSADGSAGVAAQEGDAGGFQAMLDSQTGRNAGQNLAPTMPQGIGQSSLTPQVLASGLSPAQPPATDPAREAQSAPVSAPVVATMTALRNTAASVAGVSITLPVITAPSINGADRTPETGAAAAMAAPPNGNLPVGGKILPVALAPEDSADTAPVDTPEAAKPAMAQSMVWTARLRKGAEAQAADTQTDKPVDESGDDEGNDASVANAAASAMPAPDAVLPAAIGLPAAIMLTAQPAPRSAAGSEQSAPGVTDDANGRSGRSSPASSPIAPTTLASTTPANAPAAQARPATALPLNQAGACVQDPAAANTVPAEAIPAGNALPAGLPQWLGAQQAEVTVKEDTAQIAPAPGKIAIKATKAAAQADLPESSPATPANSDTAGPLSAPQVSASAFSASPLHQATHASMQDALSPAADTQASLAAASAQPLDSASRSMAMPSESGASRDMSALVDRLVEARAAMRSGASTQWVQTSIQHAEFGRVALQIRQDGNNLSVAMASSDPDFAPAAQAALNASQSLLQPAAASQSGADTGQNQSQNAGQDNRQPGQGNSPAFNGQSGGQFSGQFSGQPGGQNQQSARQQAPFADNQIAQQAQTLRDAANAPSTGAALSGRSGILA